MSSTVSRGAWALALTAALTVPAAAESSQAAPNVEACTKTVNAMGASMSHTSDVTSDGRAIYRFVLRQNGLDYDVVCDATSGLVSDVSPRVTH